MRDSDNGDEEYSDEYVYDNAMKWDTEGYDQLSFSDCRRKWANAVKAFCDFVLEERKKGGPEVLPMAPARNASIFNDSRFVSMKNWFNIMTARGYEPKLKNEENVSIAAVVVKEKLEIESKKIVAVLDNGAVAAAEKLDSGLKTPSKRSKRVRAAEESSVKDQNVATPGRSSRAATSKKLSTPQKSTAVSSKIASITNLGASSDGKMDEIEDMPLLGSSTPPPHKKSRTQLHEDERANGESWKDRKRAIEVWIEQMQQHNKTLLSICAKHMEKVNEDIQGLRKLLEE